MTGTSALERRLFPQPAKESAARLSRLKIIRANKAFDPLLLELPDILDLLAALLANGENIYSAFGHVANRCEGTFAKAITRLMLRLNYGQDLRGALDLLAQEHASLSVSEFASKIVLALERGTPLAQQLQLLAQSARSQLRIQLLKQAGKNEVKMLIPLVFVILPVTVLVAVYPSFQLLQTTF
jgi:tight adherence protein C